MKRLLAFAVAAIITMSAAAVYADGGGCSGMTKSSAKSASCCGDMFSKLSLTPEQKTKIEALKADCGRATSTSERHQIFSQGLEKVLTPDQLEQLKAQCDAAKAKASGECPDKKGAKTNKTTKDSF